MQFTKFIKVKNLQFSEIPITRINSLATAWIASHKTRLRDLIQEELDFKLSEIEEEYSESIEENTAKTDKALKAVDEKLALEKTPIKPELKNAETAGLEECLAEKEAKILAAP